jgi:hypothetical protein
MRKWRADFGGIMLKRRGKRDAFFKLITLVDDNPTLVGLIKIVP